MLLRLLFALCVFFLLAACTGDAPEPNTPAGPAIEDQLIGSWELVDMDIEVQSFLDSDSSFTVSVREADWRKRFGVHPARVTFLADGKTRRRTRLLTGDEGDITHGLWRIENDSLLWIEPSNPQRLEIDMNEAGDQLHLRGVVDYDSDQKQDDLAGYRYRLIGRTIEAEQ